jgi:hypothetical protein
MVVQDALTGYVHEAPEPGYAEAPEAYGQMAYDGFGNPVGFVGELPLPFPFGRRTVWSPVLRRFVQMIWSPTQRRWIQPPLPGGSFPGGMPLLRRWPMGWIRPQLPYTGLGPRRLYMRCAVWPGPRGLVPADAAMMQPQPGIPGPGGAPGRRGRRRMRRRR